MTWDNYGKYWEIDHKIPIQWGNPTIEQVARRLHYTNTQPLSKKENLEKGNRYVTIDQYSMKILNEENKESLRNDIKENRNVDERYFKLK